MIAVVRRSRTPADALPVGGPGLRTLRSAGARAAFVRPVARDIRGQAPSRSTVLRAHATGTRAPPDAARREGRWGQSDRIAVGFGVIPPRGLSPCTTTLCERTPPGTAARLPALSKPLAPRPTESDRARISRRVIRERASYTVRATPEADSVRCIGVGPPFQSSLRWTTDAGSVGRRWDRRRWG